MDYETWNDLALWTLTAFAVGGPLVLAVGPTIWAWLKWLNQQGDS